MQERIVLDDGLAVLVQSRPAQGSRHEVMFGVVEGTAEPAVVKLEQIAGALERERLALEEVAAVGGPVPRLIAAGRTVLDGERLSCLVTERRSGEAPTTAEGWRRMGRAFARLGVPASPDTRLPVVDHVAFGTEHARRVEDLGALLDPLAAAVPDWRLLRAPEIPDPGPLVLTHGDPGPGNFLDDGGDGVLIDWEDAVVAPRGLDLARLVFIALLGSGPSGYEARDQRERADAVIDGYRDAASESWSPSVAASRWWTTAAGIQFIHRRWDLGGPGPWQDAADVLRFELSQTSG